MRKQIRLKTLDAKGQNLEFQLETLKMLKHGRPPTGFNKSSEYLKKIQVIITKFEDKIEDKTYMLYSHNHWQPKYGFQICR